MREFNIFGPVYPHKHYHVDRVAVKADLRARIERGRYMTLNAARQTGKTTLFREVIEELEASGEYFGILLDFEMLKSFEGEYFYEELGWILKDWRTQFQPSSPEPTPMRHHGDFVRWLRRTVQVLGKKGLLIIDKFDTICSTLSEPLLSLFRGMYLARNEPKRDSIHSIILVGIRDQHVLLGGFQAPYNISEHFTIPYFAQTEVAELLQQHTAETGQEFEPEVIEAIIRETNGQPFLVNRLAQILTLDIVTKRTQPITLADLNYALPRLIIKNDDHFHTIVSKALLHRKRFIPLLNHDQTRTNFLDADTQELIMYGVLRVVENEKKLPFARIGNPIYRKMLLLQFVPPMEDISTNRAIR